ncbi:MAG TPA: N-acetylmuramoyl-L-alanine amidase [Thermomicrobiales bacterium]|nr:N-acetylmuramoyl-L-alanine amidase [Thermomicrobiales bacterium]
MTDRVPGRGLTRREVLRYGGRAAVALPLWGLAARAGTPPVAAASPAPGRTRGGEWAAGDRLAASATGAWDGFTAPYTFGALGAHWAAGTADDVHLQLSVSADGATWSPWQTMHPDDHGAGPSRADRRFGHLLLTAPGRQVRYRAVAPGGGPTAPPPDLRLVYIDAGAGPSAADLAGRLTALAVTPLRIVPRAGWGADERLRFDKKGEEIWPPEYYMTEKLIVHHTETPNSQDPLQAIRSIYYYHAVTKGWGDIGYNFLVDHNGVIYEGRHGGDYVVGGHAYQYNYGSVGIGVIGSFMTTPDNSAIEQAVDQLMAVKGRYVDPAGSYFFIDKMIPNIVGHRDVLQTSCPGDEFYPRLPAMRQATGNLLGVTPVKNVAITGISAKGGAVVIGSPATITVTVKNTGTSVIPSYYDKGLAYTEGDTYVGKGHDKVEGRFRIAMDIAGSQTDGTAKANPYRWGFGRSINPGETVTVTCRLAFTSTGTRTLTVGLVQEYIRYWQQGLAGPTIKVVGKPTDPVADPHSTSPDLLYFAQTRHTLGGAFLHYWNKFGGLAQFGYPLTEEFAEINDADDQEYTVQYFERARFEHHPEHAGTDYEVLLGLVGRLYHAVDPPAKPIADSTHVYYPQTGHNLGGMFRYYWEQYGGLFVYGYPLTEEIAEKSRIDGKVYTVQYFERARFEFHGENTGKSQVLLGHLGRQMLQDRGWLA